MYMPSHKYVPLFPNVESPQLGGWRGVCITPFGLCEGLCHASRLCWYDAGIGHYQATLSFLPTTSETPAERKNGQQDERTCSPHRPDNGLHGSHLASMLQIFACDDKYRLSYDGTSNE